MLREERFERFGEWLKGQGFQSSTISTIIYQTKRTLEYESAYEREEFLQNAPTPFCSNYTKWCKFKEIEVFPTPDFPSEIVDCIKYLMNGASILPKELESLTITFPLQQKLRTIKLPTGGTKNTFLILIERGDFRPTRQEQKYWYFTPTLVDELKEFFYPDATGTYPLIPYSPEENRKPMLSKMLKRIRKM